jgi:putative ABC transport system permease protein
MITAFWRKLRADIKTHKLQFFLIWAVLTLSAMLLTVSLLVMGSAEDPWNRTFEATNGPHIWAVSHQHDTDFSPLMEDPAVSESSGVLMALAENPLVIGDEKISFFLYAMDEPPPVAHPLIAEGRWLEPANPDEVILDFSLARYYDFKIGDQITVLAADGNRNLKVVGLAVTAHWFPYDEITKDVSPGVAYISDTTLQAIQPDKGYWYSVVGLRLKDPSTSREFADQVYERFPGQMRSVIEWQFVKQNAALANTLNSMFMGLFSTLGLAAVGMIIFNTIGGQVLSQYREIGLLKAIGLKPTQVTLLYLVEHLCIGLIAALLGILAGLSVAPAMISTLAENLNTTPPDPYAPGPLIAVLLSIETAVALATLLPAWQGGRIDTVQAITVGYRSRRQRQSRLAQLASRLRLPMVVVLGVKDTFTRPLRAILAIASLLLTVLVAIIAVNAQTTADHLAKNRVYFHGTSADMKVMRNFVPQEIIQEEILDHPNVSAHYQELFSWGNAPDHSEQPLAVRLLSGAYQDFDFQLKEGRMIAGPGEAVMGYAVLDLIDASVGDTVEIFVEGNPLELTIVGRHTENYNMNNVVISSLETYQAQADPHAQPYTYYLQLRDNASAEDLRREWLDHSQGLIDVSITTEEPLSSVVQLTTLITSFGTILMVVAGANLMSTSLLGVRERVRDFGIQKTLGVTPAQIAGSVVIGAITVAMIALVIGVTLGIGVMESFVRQVGIQIGAGTDFYIIHWGGISLLIPILVLVAVASSLFPALRAAQIQVINALQYE